MEEKMEAICELFELAESFRFIIEHAGNVTATLDDDEIARNCDYYRTLAVEKKEVLKNLKSKLGL